MKIYKKIKESARGGNVVVCTNNGGDIIYEITLNIVSDINTFRDTFDKTFKSCFETFILKNGVGRWIEGWQNLVKLWVHSGKNQNLC